MGMMLGTMTCSSLAGEAAVGASAEDQLYQVSTIDALLAGVYDRAASVGELLQYGDFGIGTFDALDGELIALDGIVYRADSDGRVEAVPPETGTPFMAVTRFAPDDDGLRLSAPVDFAAFQEQLVQRFPSPNLIYAIKADGHFDWIRYRSVPRQQRPYPPLAAISDQQALFEQRGIEGSLIGFWCPPFVAGLNVPGFHLHFLSADRKHGGHLLDFEGARLAVGLDHTSSWQLVLPTLPSYLEADLESDRSAELHRVEKTPSAPQSDAGPSSRPGES
jgi:acetolactate decarboxylase